MHTIRGDVYNFNSGNQKDPKNQLDIFQLFLTKNKKGFIDPDMIFLSK